MTEGKKPTAPQTAKPMNESKKNDWLAQLVKNWEDSQNV